MQSRKEKGKDSVGRGYAAKTLHSPRLSGCTVGGGGRTTGQELLQWQQWDEVDSCRIADGLCEAKAAVMMISVKGLMSFQPLQVMGWHLNLTYFPVCQ